MCSFSSSTLQPGQKDPSVERHWLTECSHPQWSPHCPKPSLWPPNTVPTLPCLTQLTQGWLLCSALVPSCSLWYLHRPLLTSRNNNPCSSESLSCVCLLQLPWPITTALWRTQMFSPLVLEISGPKSAFPNSKLRVLAKLLPPRSCKGRTCCLA